MKEASLQVLLPVIPVILQTTKGNFVQYGNTLVIRIRNLAFNTPKYFSITYEKEQK